MTRSFNVILHIQFAILYKSSGKIYYIYFIYYLCSIVDKRPKISAEP